MVPPGAPLPGPLLAILPRMATGPTTDERKRRRRRTSPGLLPGESDGRVNPIVDRSRNALVISGWTDHPGEDWSVDKVDCGLASGKPIPRELTSCFLI